MKFNDKEVADIANLPADREGRLNHKGGATNRDSSSGYRERWFKLKNNLLFYYRLNEYGAVAKNEPEGVYVIEHCAVRMEPFADMPFAFSIAFLGDNEKKYYFSGPTQHHCEGWVKALNEASYDHWRCMLLQLQMQIFHITGKDPLQPYGNNAQFRMGATVKLENSVVNHENLSDKKISRSMWLVDLDS